MAFFLRTPWDKKRSFARNPKKYVPLSCGSSFGLRAKLRFLSQGRTSELAFPVQLQEGGLVHFSGVR